ncbi:hypothetical protein DLM46_01265 [Paraburkholderia lacunae]|uniref:Uncharacterized protein n=1 Tax=Paraburkholderia lacunae TaxID=2211104 RepID=A0A370NG21_9BURK|nr:hypothetical protein DLM46_01265 [Paraburkholderia lacunae]
MRALRIHGTLVRWGVESPHRRIAASPYRRIAVSPYRRIAIAIAAPRDRQPPNRWFAGSLDRWIAEPPEQRNTANRSIYRTAVESFIEQNPQATLPSRACP